MVVIGIDPVGCQNLCRLRSPVILMNQPTESVPPLDLTPERLGHGPPVRSHQTETAMRAMAVVVRLSGAKARTGYAAR
jgi:hypothetical protein